MTKETNMLELAQQYLKLEDEEMATIQSNPDYVEMIEKTPVLMRHDFIFEVDEAHGCACQHENGQQIKINGDGSLNCSDSPQKVCIYLLNSLVPIVYGAQEFVYAGLDPNRLKFKKVGCLDNKAECGGFGHVSVKFKAHSI